MAILDDYEEPENHTEYTEYLTRYYGAAAAMANLFAAAPAQNTEEVYPYEVLIFSDQPGVLRTGDK